MGSLGYLYQIKPDLPFPKYSFKPILCDWTGSFAYFYHLVNGIILGVAQSDPKKQRLLL